MTEPTIEGLNAVLNEGRLWSELEDLKSKIGLTPGKLGYCPNLLLLMETDDVTVADERIREVVLKLGDNIYTEAFGVALHLDPIPKLKKNSLVGRREWLAEYRGIATTDAIKTRELKGQQQFVELAKSMAWVTEEDVLPIVEVFGLVEDLKLTVLRQRVGEDEVEYSARGAKPPLACIVFPVPAAVRRLNIQLHFKGMRPSDVWCAEAQYLTEITLGGGAVVDLDIDDDGVAVGRWQNPVVGRYYGVVWTP